MATPKPNRAYAPRPFHLYAPTAAELSGLVKTMQDCVGLSLAEDAAFVETLRRLVLLMRKQADIQKTIPKKEAQYIELIQLRNAVRGLDKILSQQGISWPLWSRISGLMITNGLSDVNDPISGLRLHMNNLLFICKKIEKEFIDEEQKPFTLAQYRDIMTEELARALDTAGYKPTATRGGPFERCFEAFMTSISCIVEGRQVSLKPLEDPYAVVRRAIRSYPNKSIYSLLTVKKYPGLTG